MAKTPELKITIKGDTSELDRAVTDSEKTLGKVTGAANETSNAIQQINNTSKGLLETRASLAELQRKFTEVKDAGIQSGTAVTNTVRDSYRKAISTARVEIAKEREALAKELASKPVILPINPEVVKGPTNTRDSKGLTVGQLRQANAQLPAQFSDIVVSLQGGQSPLTVLLQQGAQLKDQFNGIGNAARAMAGYIAALITPITLIVGAVGVLAVAYNQGSKEADAFRVALLNTGNAAGTSTDQLAGMASSLGNNFGTTTSKAAEVLAQLAATSRVARTSLEEFAAVAIQAEKAFGISIEEITKNFAELGKDPVGASERLNESMNYLTASTYAQIQAAIDMGDQARAEAIAQDAYAIALKGRSSEMISNLGYIERAFGTLMNVARETWDIVAGVGRKTPLKEELDKAEKLQTDTKNAQKLYGGKDSFFGKLLDGNIARSTAAVDNLKEIDNINKRAGDAAERRAEKEKAGIQAQKDSVKYLTDEQKLRKKIAEETATMRKAEMSDADIKKRSAQITESFNKKKGGAKKGAEVFDLSNPEAESMKRSLDLFKFYQQEQERLYKLGEISASAYFDKKIEDIQAESEAQAISYEKQKARLEADLGSAKTPEGQNRVRGAMEKAATEDQKIQLDLASKLRDTDIARAEAMRKYAEQVNATNIQYLELIGSATTAAAIEARRVAINAKYAEQIKQASEEQRAQIEVIKAAELASLNLAAMRTEQARELVDFSTRRAVIEQQMAQGQISEVNGKQQLYELDQQRYELIILQQERQLQTPGLLQKESDAIKSTLDAAKLGMQQLSPLAAQLSTTIRGGLEGAFTNAIMQMGSLKDGLRAVAQEVAMIFARRAAAQAAGGLITAFGFAEGGHVVGPGTETSDSINARLSNNEFVMPAKAVRAYGVGFMESIRQLKMPSMPTVASSISIPTAPRFASGGLVNTAAQSGDQRSGRLVNTAAQSGDQSSGMSFPVQVNVTNEGSSKNATASTDFDGKNIVVSVMLEDIRNNGPVFRSMSTASKARR